MPTLLLRGKPYQFEYPKQDAGAIADFLRLGGNRLLVVLSGMTSTEEWALRNGMITAGFAYSDGAMLWLFRFYGKNGVPLLTFDAPFDARLIPAEDRQLHSIDNAEQRLLIEIHAVDEKGILRAIRAATISPKLTLAFLSAVQEQLSTLSDGTRQMSEWMQKEPDHLAKTIDMEALGR